MHILILGAAGMVGRKLTEHLLADGRLGNRDITRLTLQDVVAPAKPAQASIAIQTVICFGSNCFQYAASWCHGLAAPPLAGLNITFDEW